VKDKNWDEALTICVEWLAENDRSEETNTRGLRYTLITSVIETLEGALVLADVLAEHRGGDVFRDNNDNYLRLLDTLRIFKQGKTLVEK
jgi:hypothetical protein